MLADKTINWGIIGCGNVTEVKSGPAFQKIAGSRLLAVMRRQSDLARDYALRHGVPLWYDKADALLANPDIQAVYIATPPGSHAEYAIQALKAGKAVYVEKPMAAHHAECLEMNKVAQQTGNPLFVAYYRRALPGFVTIKQLIQKGAIGRPVYFAIRYFRPASAVDAVLPPPWRLVPEISGGGYIYDLGSHQLDLIDYLLGPLQSWSSTTHSRNKIHRVEDFVAGGFVGEGGITGSAVWDFAAPANQEEDSMEIRGDQGLIRFSCFSFKPIELHTDGTIQYFENIRPQHVQQPFIQQVVNHLLGKTYLAGNGESAARTSKILDALTHKTL